MLMPQPRSGDGYTTDSSANQLESMERAERELAAFMAAVTDSFGSEQAGLAAEDWLDELETSDALPGVGAGSWRRITIAAAARLATRVAVKLT
jgi:hypothetical protein